MANRSGGTLASRGAMSNASDETRKLYLGNAVCLILLDSQGFAILGQIWQN
jgi:hypothetical protein